ncbi:MAG: hypothetical protein U9N09_10585 [Euryarchaeota archaeon]|nr:hypothetical protein [Euryarchaeota archaeon]
MIIAIIGSPRFRTFKDRCEQVLHSTTFLMAADTGILPERAERIMRSMVDGIIQFRTTYAGDKINRFISIPKLKGVLPMRKMIPFYITAEGISIDTRERVG